MTVSTSTAPDAQTLTTEQTSGAESRFLLHCLDWQGYEKLLKLFGDDGPRVSYLDGVVELMSPGMIHEQDSQVLSNMVTDPDCRAGYPGQGAGINHDQAAWSQTRSGI